MSSAKLIYNAMVVTMDPSRRFFENGAVWIEGDTIRAVDSSDALLNSLKNEKALEKIDAKSQLLIPGLVNAHTHSPMSLFRGVAEDMPINQWWAGYIFPAEQKFLNDEYVSLGSELSILEMLLSGTTTFADFYFFTDAICRQVDKHRMRAVIGQALVSFPAPDCGSWENQRENALRFVSEWKSHPRITPALAPHAPYSVKKEHLKDVLQIAAQENLYTSIHVAEGDDEMQKIAALNGFPEENCHSPVQYLESLGFLNSNVSVAHLIYADRHDLELILKNQTKVIHCPQSNLKLGSGVAKVAQMIEMGITVGLGTDGPASNNDLSLWGEIDFAGKLQKGILLDPSVMSSEKVFSMATIDGAKSLGLDHLIGSIEVGKKADLVLIDLNKPHLIPLYNVYSHLVHAVNGADVSSVYVDGEQLVGNGKLVNFSEDQKESLFAKMRALSGEVSDLLKIRDRGSHSKNL